MSPGMSHKKVYILYGSETGNSEDIASDIHEKCVQCGIESVCQSLNSVKNVDLRDTALFIVLTCSTTGNADTPRNATGWWRDIKLRSTVLIRALMLQSRISTFRLIQLTFFVWSVYALSVKRCLREHSLRCIGVGGHKL